MSGLVHISLLSRRFVTFNESDQTLSAPGGRTWRVGDRIRVHVARVDFRDRKLDFVPCDAEETRQSPRGGKMPRGGKRRNGK